MFVLLEMLYFNTNYLKSIKSSVNNSPFDSPSKSVAHLLLTVCQV